MMPVEIITQSKMAKTHAFRCRMVQNPITDFVFRQINRGHEWQNDIVQRHTDGGGDLIAIKEPGNTDGEQRLHAPKRREPKKNADCQTQSDRVRRVLDRNQAFVVRPPPIFKTRPQTPACGLIASVSVLQIALPAVVAFL